MLQSFLLYRVFVSETSERLNIFSLCTP